jgi:hypothetical protein
MSSTELCWRRASSSHCEPWSWPDYVQRRHQLSGPSRGLSSAAPHRGFAPRLEFQAGVHQPRSQTPATAE